MAPPARTGARWRRSPLLDAYAWPGNVRELENVVERIALLFASGTPPGGGLEARLRLVVPELHGATAASPLPPPRAGIREERARKELAELRRAVAECDGNVSEAARRLGIGRSTIYRKLGQRPA
jgi:propionate catabolism operon transcriptional regulator